MPTVIKNAQLTGHRTGPLQVLNLLDYEAEARRILAAARKQAELLLADAERKAARLREEARQSGHREGLAKGLEEGRLAGREEAFRQAVEEFTRQQASLVQAFGNALAGIEEQKQRLALAARTDVLRVAVAIARRVVKRMAEDRATAEAIAIENASEALEMIGPRTDAVLRLNPADREALEAFAKDLAESARQKRHIRVVADAAVAPGGCILTTEEGRIDARLETQLARIAELLVGEEGASEGPTNRQGDEATESRSDAAT